MSSPLALLSVMMAVVAVVGAAEPIQCGGIAGLGCPSGLECIPDPRNTGCVKECGVGADCGGICARRKYGECRGIAGLKCRGEEMCVDTVADGCNAGCNGRDCLGNCFEVKVEKECGGFAGLQCGTGETCMYRKECSPDCGGADCLGVCAKTTGQACGGIHPTTCGADEECFDVAHDGCHPECNGRDCLALCGRIMFATTAELPRRIERRERRE